MSRMFIARSRARPGARNVVLNTGCERQSDVASLGEALLQRTTQGDSRYRPRELQGINLQKCASLSSRRSNSVSGTFRRVIPEVLDMLQHVEAADGEAHGEVVHVSPTCGQDSALNRGGEMQHTQNPNLADFMRLLESILNKQQAKLVVIENVPGELQNGVVRRQSRHGGCVCNDPRATPVQVSSPKQCTRRKRATAKRKKRRSKQRRKRARNGRRRRTPRKKTLKWSRVCGGRA
jgi:hypothetical protein